jgi:hypothetical protein
MSTMTTTRQCCDRCGELAAFTDGEHTGPERPGGHLCLLPVPRATRLDLSEETAERELLAKVEELRDELERSRGAGAELWRRLAHLAVELRHDNARLYA